MDGDPHTPPQGPAAELAALARLADAALAALDREGERLAIVVPEVSRWSPRMQFDHAALATSSVCGAIERILTGDPRCTAPGAPSPQLAAILTAGFIPRGVADAPDAMRPPPDVTEAAVRDHLVALRVRLAALGSRTEEIASERRRLPHFALGPMTPAEWLRFARIHFDHHAAIARDVLDG